jgi:hypothetical protein
VAVWELAPADFSGPGHSRSRRALQMGTLHRVILYLNIRFVDAIASAPGKFGQKDEG